MLHAAIVATWVALMKWLHSQYFGSALLPGFAERSYGERFLVGILLVDLCMWAQHRVNHIVPWFWQFHTVHHSQKEISFFTDFR